MLRTLAAAIGFAALLGLALFAAKPALAAEQAVRAMDNGQIQFAMPSGNVGCLYTPAGGTDTYEPKDGGPELICERIEPTYVTVIFGPVGEPEVIEDPGEQSCCGAENILAYGNTVTFEGFMCWSQTTGLICERLDGLSFSMARAGIEVFEVESDEGEDEELYEGDAEAD